MGDQQQDHGHFSDGQATLPHDAGAEQGGDFSEGQEKMHPDKRHTGSFAHGQEGSAHGSREARYVRGWEALGLTSTDRASRATARGTAPDANRTACGPRRSVGRVDSKARYRVRQEARVVEFFDNAYRDGGIPTWDVGRPQGAVVRLAAGGLIVGSVLDAGCGTGDNALHLAALGHPVVGRGLRGRRDRARGHGEGRRPRPPARVPASPTRWTWQRSAGRSTPSSTSACSTRSATPSAPALRREPARRRVRPGGQVVPPLLERSEPVRAGPATGLAGVRSTGSFRDGWRVEAIDPEWLDTRLPEGRVHAWLARIVAPSMQVPEHAATRRRALAREPTSSRTPGRPVARSRRGRVCSRREPPRCADRTPLLLSPASAGTGCARGRLLTARHPQTGTRDSLAPRAAPAAAHRPASPGGPRPVSSVLTPPARQVDPRGQRFGAGVSAVVLVVAFILSLPWLAALVGLNLAISAAFGTRLFLPGRLWPIIRRSLSLGPTAARARVPAALRPGHGRDVHRSRCRRLPGRRRARSAGCSSGPWQGSRSCSPPPGSASAAASTSCAGGCPSQFARIFRRADQLVGISVGPPISFREP